MFLSVDGQNDEPEEIVALSVLTHSTKNPGPSSIRSKYGAIVGFAGVCKTGYEHESSARIIVAILIL